jgi:hypothetical protein
MNRIRYLGPNPGIFSLVLIISGLCLIIYAASFFMFPLALLIVGFILLHYGLSMRGFPSLVMLLSQIFFRRFR